MSGKTSFFGLPENLAAACSYVLGPFTGIAALVLEKENKFVRFHALQSTVALGAAWIISGIVGFIPIINWFSWIVNLVIFVCAVWLVFNAYKGNKYKIPIIGEAVEAQIEK